MTHEETIKRIQELKSDIEYEEMMYKIGEEHPTYTEQFSRGQQNVRGKIRTMREELSTLLDNFNDQSEETKTFIGGLLGNNSQEE